MGVFDKKKAQTQKVIDPVEAAKVAAPAVATRAPSQPSPAAQVIQPPAPTPVAPQAAQPVLAAAPATVLSQERKPHRARVKVGRKVSLRGSMTFLPAGTIVSEASYGAGIFARLADAKVELELLD